MASGNLNGKGRPSPLGMPPTIMQADSPSPSPGPERPLLRPATPDHPKRTLAAAPPSAVSKSQIHLLAGSGRISYSGGVGSGRLSSAGDQLQPGSGRVSLAGGTQPQPVNGRMSSSGGAKLPAVPGFTSPAGSGRISLAGGGAKQQQGAPDSPASTYDGHHFLDYDSDEEGQGQGEKKTKPHPRLQRSDAMKRGVTIHKIDAFATKIVESSSSGGAVTLLVWAATVAYIVMVVIQWLQTPPTKVVGTEWTIGAGPFPMQLTCMARSGCLISNVLSSGNTLGINDSVTPAQTVCTSLAYNQTLTIDMVFSVDPTEGLSVMWEPSTANTTSLLGGGLVVLSQIRCPGDAPSQDTGCVFILPTPIAPGTALLQYVETANDTATGAAQQRKEWFANMISPDGSVLPRSTPCYDPSNPDPKLAGWVQGRLRINSFYNTVTVSKDSFWLFLFGAVGGAYALFLQLGGICLALIAFTWGMHEKWQEKRATALVHDEATASQRGPAPSREQALAETASERFANNSSPPSRNGSQQRLVV